MYSSVVYFSIFYAIVINFCFCLEPISITAAGVALIGSISFAGYKYINCTFYECCDKTWIKFTPDKLEKEMDEKLFGQHLVKFAVMKSLKAHVEKKEPKKALVMSFHGDTGCGKNHVSKLIYGNLYKEGKNSQYVHMYIGTRDFPHKDKVNEYRDRLRKEIEEKTKLCGRSLFIFDEIDKIPPGILDVLTPYLDYHDSVDGVDFRRNIFIFLSNAGAHNIAKVVLQYWSNGMEREKIPLKDVENLITRGAYNENGGLYHSDAVKRDLINVYVPFLPLTKEHVKMCIKSELDLQDLSGDVDMIANELHYFPNKVELFAINGCKTVAQKVDFYGVKKNKDEISRDRA